MAYFTPDQIGQLSAKLDKGSVKGRKQGGRTVSYIEGWHAIAEANRIFGYDAWDRETVDIRCVAEKPRKIGDAGKEGFGVGYIAKVRVTVRASDRAIVREGTGYGSGIDVDVGAAHESAIKEAETDAMKRALMTFGNPFGLALYDKEQTNVEGAEPPKKDAPKDAADPRRDQARTWADKLVLKVRGTNDPGHIDDMLAGNRKVLEELKDAYPDIYETAMKLITDHATTAKAAA